MLFSTLECQAIVCYINIVKLLNFPEMVANKFCSHKNMYYFVKLFDTLAVEL